MVYMADLLYIDHVNLCLSPQLTPLEGDLDTGLTACWQRRYNTVEYSIVLEKDRSPFHALTFFIQLHSSIHSEVMTESPGIYPVTSTHCSVSSVPFTHSSVSFGYTSVSKEHKIQCCLLPGPGKLTTQPKTGFLVVEYPVDQVTRIRGIV